MRLIIADDSALVREGLARLVTEAGHEVLVSAADLPSLESAVEGLEQSADVAILDIRMPPGHSDEGARAALWLRQRQPEIGVLLLSQQIEARTVLRLMQQHARGFGYLLKDRILELDDLLQTLDRVARGGFAVDPDVVQQLMTAGRNDSARQRLTPRELQVLSLIAEGCSNKEISRRLRLSDKTVENHTSSIFAKLHILDDPSENKRVRAALMFLDGA